MKKPRAASAEIGLEAFLGDISSYNQGNNTRRPIVVSGVAIRDYKSRPNVVEECRRAMTEGSKPRESTGRIASQADTLWLEDQTMRLELIVPDTFAGRLATGIVIAVKGTPSGNGKLHVHDVSFPCALARPSPLPTSVQASKTFIALTSGLHFGDSNAAACRELLASFLAGCIRGTSVSRPGNVCRVVICGGLLATKDGEALSPAESQTALVEADTFLSQLCASVPVDLMPGKADPSGAALPQAALSPLLFKSLRSCRDFKAVGNPYEADFGGLRMLGHSGTPVEDLIRCSVGLDDPLDALQLTLQARHLAPTAPDTLTTQPLAKGAQDPFVIGSSNAVATPHVLFSGCHAQAAHRWCALPEPGRTWAAPGHNGGGVSAIAVPALHSSTTVVLVNLHDATDVRIVSLQ